MFFFHMPRHPSPGDRPLDHRVVMDKLSPFASPDAQGYLTHDSDDLLVQCVHWNTARSRREPSPYRHESPLIHAASWARIDNRSELADMLGLSQARMDTLSDTELIVQCYLAWGEKAIGRLIGDFVFVVHDIAQNTVFCGRDHMGVRPLYYADTGKTFACATSLAAFESLESIPHDVDRKWMADYLLGLSMSFDQTPYKQIMKLPPSHCLTVTSEGVRLRKYHDLRDVKERRLSSSSEYVEAYKETLETAIRCRMDSEYLMGSELSGGLDSSTITACAAQFMGKDRERLHTFGFSFCDLEPEYILAVSRHLNIAHNHMFAARKNAPDQKTVKILGSPVEHANATIHEPFYVLAEKLGIRTLLSGFGGDEFVTTIHGAMILDELAEKRKLTELFHLLPGNTATRLLRLVYREIRRKRSAQTGFNPRLYQAFKNRWPHHILNETMVRDYDLETRFFDQARFDAGYTDLKRFTLEKRWQPFVPTRMENCSLMAWNHKIEYRWPLLDVRLVRFFLSVPSNEHYFRGMGRYLHRRAIDGIIPQRVAWKQNKDMGSPSSPDSLMVDGENPEIAFSDLHPVLADMIDTKKLAGQLESQRGRPQAISPAQFQTRRNCHNISALNAWLKHMDGVYGSDAGITKNIQ